jgi:hypothetical protein
VRCKGIFLLYSLTNTPPAALISATAYSYPGFTIAPSAAYLPVRGTEAPISMAAGAGGGGTAVGGTAVGGTCVGGTAVGGTCVGGGFVGGTGVAVGAAGAQLAVTMLNRSTIAITLATLDLTVNPPLSFL